MKGHDGMKVLKMERLNACKNAQAAQEERTISYLIFLPRLKVNKNGVVIPNRSAGWRRSEESSDS